MTAVAGFRENVSFMEAPDCGHSMDTPNGVSELCLVPTGRDAAGDPHHDWRLALSAVRRQGQCSGCRYDNQTSSSSQKCVIDESSNLGKRWENACGRSCRTNRETVK